MDVQIQNKMNKESPRGQPANQVQLNRALKLACVGRGIKFVMSVWKSPQNSCEYLTCKTFKTIFNQSQ